VAALAGVWLAVELVEVKWERRDLWIGLYWDRKADGLHFYVCPLPTLLLHWRKR